MKVMELYSRRHNYICLYSAKSGCSSMRRIFLELHAEEEGVDPSVGYHNLERFFPVPSGLDRSGVMKIMVCRDPYSRMVSSFANRYISTDEFLRLSFNRSQAGPLIRDDFVSFLRRLSDLDRMGELDHFNIHVRRQTFGVDLSDPKLVLVRLERFEDQIRKAYSIVAPDLLPRVRVAHENPTEYERYSSCASKRVFLPGESFPHFSRMYDRECMSIVSEVYGADFVGLGYPFSIRHGILV